MNMFIRGLVVILLSILNLLLSQAQVTPDPTTPEDWVISKNYPATYLIFKDAELSKKLFSASALQPVLSERYERYVSAKNCEDMPCILQAFRWTESEMTTVNTTLLQLMQTEEDLRNLVESKLMPSHGYGVSTDQEAASYLSKAIEQDMRAANYVVEVYAGGRKPNYPNIDSLSFDANSKRFLALLKAVRQDVLVDCDESYEAAFLSMLSAVRLLEINERMDAASLEPLMEGENKKAFDKIKSTDFDQYSYSLLLVLGAGPSAYDQPISPAGMLRARMASRAYFEGKAPFIVLSGGRVHPYKTRFVEALEMKRYLVNELLVPEESIILDAHARHTTTNLRNTARIMLRYGFPQNQYAMATSSEAHIDAVERMEPRCIKELGYVPYVLGKRINAWSVEFKPRLEALTVDPDEPLDP
ncbi:MAG: YdcF family protein [Sphingobacterium sp.]